MISLLVSVTLVGGQSSRWISSGPARNIATPWHLDSLQKRWPSERSGNEEYSFVHTSHLDPKNSHLFFILFLCVSAHWLQREARQPADVHWNRRWPLLEAARLLPGAPDHRENRSHSQPRNSGLQHQSSRNSSPAWKQYVSQVSVRSTWGLHYSYELTTMKTTSSSEKNNHIYDHTGLWHLPKGIL